jgi:hypothetical protein
MLSYVECDPKGLGARPDRCERAAVRRYPTWTTGPQRFEGVLTLGELASA